MFALRATRPRPRGSRLRRLALDQVFPPKHDGAGDRNRRVRPMMIPMVRASAKPLSTSPPTADRDYRYEGEARRNDRSRERLVDRVVRDLDQIVTAPQPCIFAIRSKITMVSFIE